MTNSYLPAGVQINCTFMTKPKPGHLGYASNGITVTNQKKNAMFLNVDATKIDICFMCKVSGSFWGGLAGLCAGIAVGVLLAGAIVATGGLAAGVIVAVAATSLLGAGVAAVTGIIKQVHDCDASIEGKWKKYHGRVNFSGKSALLQHSFLQCPKGGILQPFLDPVTADKAAKKFSSENNKEVNKHVAFQFCIGTVSGLSTLGSPVTSVLVAGLSVYEYNEGYQNYSVEKTSLKDDFEKAADDAVRDNIKIGGAPAAIESSATAAKAVTELNAKIVPELMAQGATRSQAVALRDAFGFGFKEFGKKAGANLAKGIGASFGAALVNLGLNRWNQNERIEHNENVQSYLKELIKEDQNSIEVNVIAKQTH